MKKRRRYQCPVCGFNDLDEPPDRFDICPSCGTEFGYHDAGTSHEQLRATWIAEGAPWSSRVTKQPADWDAYAQLLAAGLERPILQLPRATVVSSSTVTLSASNNSSGSRHVFLIGPQLMSRARANSRAGRSVPSDLVDQGQSIIARDMEFAN